MYMRKWMRIISIIMSIFLCFIPTLIFAAPDWHVQFLSFLMDPNIVYILMLIALYGLFFEFCHPGLVLPGVSGLIALLLVLYVFQFMPINYAGVALLLVGIIFILFEIYVFSFGIIGLGGVIAFILGSAMLFDISNSPYHVSWTLIIIMSILTATFFFLMLNLAVRAHKKSVITGREGLIGEIGIVISVAHQGNQEIKIQLLGEIWQAESSSKLHMGQKVKVVRIQGLTLFVEPI